MDFQKLIYENNMLREQLHRSQQTYEMLVRQFQSLLQKNKDLKDAADQQEKIWHERLENEQAQFGEAQKQLADLQKKYDALLDAFQKQQDQLAQFQIMTEEQPEEHSGDDSVSDSENENTTTFSEMETACFQKVKEIAEAHGLADNVLSLQRGGVYTDILYEHYTMLRFKLSGKIRYWLVDDSAKHFSARKHPEIRITPSSKSNNEYGKKRVFIQQAADLDAFQDYIIERYSKCKESKEDYDNWVSAGKPMHFGITAHIDLDENGKPVTRIERVAGSGSRQSGAGKMNHSAKDYTVIDLETTGINPNTCEIIEMAAVRVRNCEITERYSVLVKPENPIPSEVEGITGITNEMVRDAPGCGEVIRDYLDFIGEDIAVGHNIKSYDAKILRRFTEKYLHADFSNELIDTLHFSKCCDISPDNYRLTTLSAYFGIPHPDAHRALGDCIANQKIYEAMKPLLTEKYR